MSNLTLRQVTSATEPAETAAKGSALTHVEMDSNLILLNEEKLENIVDDTTPQLGGTLDTNDKAIGNAGVNGYIDFEKRIEIDENIADYSITVDNQNEQGLGLRIKAGDKDYAGSLAILSVSDKNNVNQFIVKANGETTAYENLTIGRPGTDSGVNGIIYIQPGSIGTLNSGDDLNVTTNGGTLSLNSIDFPSTDGSANQILQTNGSGALSFVNKPVINDETDPTLSVDFDQNGNMIKDDSRNYQILGNTASPSSDDFDSFNNTARVFGVVKVDKTTGLSNRYHSNPTLSKVVMTADATGTSNAGRLRMNYFEGMLEMDGFDNTTSGFGRGQNGIFASTLTSNSNASNTASTLAEQRGLTITTQTKSDSTGGLTVSDSRCINMEPNINSNALGGDCIVTNQYGLYYSSVNDGPGSSAYTNEYSLYGATANAGAYNAGGFQLPSVAVANLTTAVPQTTGNMVFCTDETGGAIPVFYDGTNWRRMSDRAIAS